jgi:hypothetical protein
MTNPRTRSVFTPSTLIVLSKSTVITVMAGTQESLTRSRKPNPYNLHGLPLPTTADIAVSIIRMNTAESKSTATSPEADGSLVRSIYRWLCWERVLRASRIISTTRIRMVGSANTNTFGITNMRLGRLRECCLWKPPFTPIVAVGWSENSQLQVHLYYRSFSSHLVELPSQGKQPLESGGNSD